MLFDLQSLTLALSILHLVDGLPFDGAQKPRSLVQRAKSYAIVNVDGGSTAPPDTTTVVEETTQLKTETVKVTHAAPAVTETVTAPSKPTPAPSPPTNTPSSKMSTSTSTSYTSTSTPKNSSSPPPSSSTKPTPTPATSIVTVIITESVASTEYYDNGLWHTLYPVKTVQQAAVATTTSSTPSSTVDSSVAQSYNGTQI